MPRYAIVLAGGRSTRMGREKAGLTLDGRSLLAHAVAACATWGDVVVVAPHLPEDIDAASVVLALEDPPLGGPVAGLAAGLAALPASDPADEVLLLACDLPRVAEIVALLCATRLGRDGSCLADDDGRRQFLAGRYLRSALQGALPAEPRNVAVRAVLSGLRLSLVPSAGLAADVDTPDDAARAGIQLG